MSDEKQRGRIPRRGFSAGDKVDQGNPARSGRSGPRQILRWKKARKTLQTAMDDIARDCLNFLEKGLFIMRKRKIILPSILFLALTAVCVMTATASGFRDTEGCWAEEAITRWTGHGVVQGYDDGFRPGAAVTRGQMAMILNNLLKLTKTADVPFTDVTDGAVYAEAVQRCYAAGIMLGNNGKALPAAAVTREAAFVMLARSLSIRPQETAELSAFRDGAKISGYAAPYVAALAEAGVVGGLADGSLAPFSTLSRAQLMTILDRAIVQYIPESGTFQLTDRDGIVLVAAGDVTLTGQTSADILISPAASGKTVAFDGASVTGSITVQADSAKVSVSKDSDLPFIALDGENCRIERSAPAPFADSGSSGDDDDDSRPATPSDPGPSEEDSGGTTTEHKLNDTWAYDDFVHWRSCDVEGCDLRHDCGAHVWDGGVVVKEASASEAGVRTFTCTVCHSTRTETIPPVDGFGLSWRSPGVLQWKADGDPAGFQIQIHRGTPAGADTLVWSMDCQGSAADLSPALGVLSEHTDTPLTVILFSLSSDGDTLREAGRIASGIEIAVSEQLPAPELCYSFVGFLREPGCICQVYWPANYQDGTAIWCWQDGSEAPAKREFRVMSRSEMGTRYEDRIFFDPGDGDTLAMRVAADSRLREDGVWSVTLSQTTAADFHRTDVPSGFHLIENSTKSLLNLAMTPPRDTDCLENSMTCRYYPDGGGEPVLTKNLACGIRNFPFLEDLRLLEAGEKRLHLEFVTTPTAEAASRGCLPGRAVFDVCVAVTDLSGTPDQISVKRVPRLEGCAFLFSGFQPGTISEVVLGTAAEGYILHTIDGGTAEIVLPDTEADALALTQWTTALSEDGSRADIRRVSYPELSIQAAAPEEIGPNGYGTGLEIEAENDLLQVKGIPDSCFPWLMGEDSPGVRLDKSVESSFIIPPDAAEGVYDHLFLCRESGASDPHDGLFSVISLEKPVKIEKDTYSDWENVECAAANKRYVISGLKFEDYTYLLQSWKTPAQNDIFSMEITEQLVVDGKAYASSEHFFTSNADQVRLIARRAEEESEYLLQQYSVKALDPIQPELPPIA